MVLLEQLYRRNDALDVNRPGGDEALTTNGSSWLFAVCAIFTLTFLVAYNLSFKPRHGEKFFHYLFTIAAFVGAIAYFAMGSDLAYNVIAQSNSVGRSGFTRQIFWAKYVYWLVSFPATVVALGVLSGVSWATILFDVFLSWIWVIGYLVAAHTSSNYKWGFFAFATLAWIYLALDTLVFYPRSSKRVGVPTNYTALAGWTNLLWLMYPIAWALSDGGNYIGVTPSLVWFGILDILMIPVLTAAFLALGRRWDYNRLNIAFTQYGRVPVHHGAFDKGVTAPGATSANAPGVTSSGLHSHV